MIGRSYSYSTVIKISRSDMSLLRGGKKRCTVRLGSASVTSPEIEMTDGRTSVRVRITNVDNARTFEQLTDADAKAEGFASRDELLLDLRKYYPRIAAGDHVTVIFFEPISASASLFAD